MGEGVVHSGLLHYLRDYILLNCLRQGVSLRDLTCQHGGYFDDQVIPMNESLALENLEDLLEGAGRLP